MTVQTACTTVIMTVRIACMTARTISDTTANMIVRIACMTASTISDTTARIIVRIVGTITGIDGIPEGITLGPTTLPVTWGQHVVRSRQESAGHEPVSAVGAGPIGTEKPSVTGDVVLPTPMKIGASVADAIGPIEAEVTITTTEAAMATIMTPRTVTLSGNETGRSLLARYSLPSRATSDNASFATLDSRRTKVRICL